MIEAEPSPFDLIQLELVDVLFSILVDRWPDAAKAVAEEMRARSHRPAEHASSRNAVFATMLERMIARLAPPAPPEPPPGTVSLAAARALRGKGTGPTGRPAA